MRKSLVVSVVFLFAAAFAQVDNNAAAAQKARVFVTDSQSWQVTGGGGGNRDAWGSQFAGGARPQTAEIIKTFGERCPDIVVNNQRDRADYVAVLDHEGGKGYARRDNKIAVFNRAGDVVVSRSTRSLGNAVKDACQAITTDWTESRARSSSSTTIRQASPEMARSSASH